VGQTALKTREVIQKALGGVLLIDEAYALSRYETGNDFGIEAIDTLVAMMEEHRETWW
jgi:stage V sporulation protein K